MDANTRITQLEDEFKVLKNEVLAVLLDMKESLLSAENPFTKQAPMEMPTINITQSLPAAAPTRSEPASPKVNGNGNGNGHKNGNTQEAPGSLNKEAINHDEDEKKPEIECQQPLKVETKATKTVQDMPSQPTAVASEDSFKSWQSALDSYGGEASHVADNAGNSSGTISLESLSGLMIWVQTASMRMGRERIQTILDISEMMGQIPSKLKIVLEKMIPDGDHCPTPEKVSARIYLDSLKDLARLLNKKNASDFIVLHIVSQGLTSIARTGNG